MSCTTNVPQKLTQVTDKSHQRDTFRQQEAAGSFRSHRPSDLNQEFNKFAQAPGVDWQFEVNNAPAFHQPMAQNASPAYTQTPQQGRPEAWIQQFQSMSVETQQPLQNPMNSYLAQQSNRPHASFAPRFAYAEAPAVYHQEQHMRPVPAAPEQQTDFDKAFSAAETRMNALSSHMNPEAVSGDGVDLQKVAEGVLHTVENTTTSDKMAEKMKNSNFMNLMLQLKNKQAVVKDNEIVASGDQHQSTGTDWQGPSVHQVEIKQPLYQERLKDPVGGQQPKEDVQEYLQRIGTPDGLNSSQKPEKMMSSFEAANEFAPEQIPVANWEEDYSEWVAQ